MSTPTPQEDPSVNTDVEPRAGSEVALADEAALAAAVLGDLDQQDLVLPMLQVAQQLSRVVEQGDAEAGEFVNSLTGENHGSRVELIIAGYFKGRFFAPKGSGETYIAQGDVAPGNWPEEFAGRRFDEIEEAEEL